MGSRTCAKSSEGDDLIGLGSKPVKADAVRALLGLADHPGGEEHAVPLDKDRLVRRERGALQRGRRAAHSIGGDALLNVGTWRETKVASGIDSHSGERVALMAVEPATQPITEYDLVDVNCLLEWTHAQVTKVLKQYVKEREIDQEIDFSIIRGDRKDATRSSQDKPKSGRRMFSRKA